MAEEFSLPNLKGEDQSLKDLCGQVILVNYWATWCPSCIYEMPGLQHLNEALASDSFEILAINVGEPRFKVKKFVKLIDLNLTVLLDTTSMTFNAWNATVLPTSFILDKNGIIRYRVQGSIKWDDKSIVSIIKQLTSEKEPIPCK